MSLTSLFLLAAVFFVESVESVEPAAAISASDVVPEASEKENNLNMYKFH